MTTPTLELEPSSRSPQPRVRLLVLAGPHKGMSWTFECPVTLTIGREPPAQLVLDREPALSRRHWRLQSDGSLVHLRDDGSRNGTLVNGLRVLEASLQHGDRFGIGDTELKLEIHSDSKAETDPQTAPPVTSALPAENAVVPPADAAPLHSPSIEQTNANVIFAPEETYALLANAGLPEPLHDVLRRSIDQQADQRFQSCEGFLEASQR